MTKTTRAAALVLLVLATLMPFGMGCAWILANDELTCPPSNPKCTCLGEKTNYACVDNWTNQLVDPNPLRLARDAGPDVEVGPNTTNVQFEGDAQ